MVRMTNCIIHNFKLDTKFFLYRFQKNEEKYMSFSDIIFPIVEYRAPKEGPKGIKQINNINKLNWLGYIVVKIKNNISNILQIPK